MYKYLLWDIDGTLLDFKAAENLAMKALFKKYNLIECTDEMIEDYSRINEKYWQALERGEMTKPQILRGRFAEYFETIGVDTSIAESFNADYQVTLGDFVVYEEGALDILKEQRSKTDDKGQRAYRIIAVTNGTKVAQEKKLKTSGLDVLFDAVYISEDVGIEKPNKGFFDAVFAGEGIASNDEAVIIGDSLTSDICGGNNASIDTIWYNPNKKVNDKNVTVTHEINSLYEIRNVIG